jgi:ATP-dependent DNA helicase RecQ
MLTAARELLEKHFGFREFLDAQEEVIGAILAGEDALVVMPTGGGKSLCYQLPALLKEGVTVVVSPLIALMKDQVDALQRRGIPAAILNSTLSLTEQHERIRQVRSGECKLVYIAPERFRSRAFLEALGQTSIALFAVDEAHCISQWGHDFRPDYFALGDVLDRLGRPQVAAFTATATPEVRQDILKQLRLDGARQFVAGFARPNLRLAVQHVDREAEKYERLLALAAEHKTGIVYCATRKRVEAVQAALIQAKIKAVAYHAGLSDPEREKAQNDFISRRSDVAVATNAFGMGIDRSDIRFVAHFEAPGSVEAYYQEAGRAGRDGEPSVCELYFNFADTRVQEFFIEGSNPSRRLIQDVYGTLRSAAGPEGELTLPIRDIAARLGGSEAGVHDMAVSAAMSVLSRAGYIERVDVPGERTRGTRIPRPEVKPHQIELDWAALAEKERRDRSKLKAMLELVYAHTCRQQAILRYFGEPDPQRCGNCDACSEHKQVGRREGSEDEVLVLRKALSGVARMSLRTSEGWQPRFGKGRIVQALIGSRTRPVLDARLDELSTYGILSEEGVSYVNELFREMQSAGLVTQIRQAGSDGKDYQLLTLTALGDKVMRGQDVAELSWPERTSARSPVRATRTERRSDAETPPAGAQDTDIDPRLLDALKKKREELAQAQGDVPRYQIFSDDTLRSFARLRPKDVPAARRIRGVGEMKAERYVPAFLEVIREYGGEDP